MRAIRDQALAVAIAVAAHGSIMIAAWAWASRSPIHVFPFHVAIPVPAALPSLGSTPAEPAPAGAASPLKSMPASPAPPRPPRVSIPAAHAAPVEPASIPAAAPALPIASITPSATGPSGADDLDRRAEGAQPGDANPAPTGGARTAGAPNLAGVGPPARPAPDPVDPDALQRAIQAVVRYPRIARQEGVEGRVVVRFRVDEAGAPVELSIARSAGDLLDAAALEAVRRAAPFHSGPGWVRVPVDFSLRAAP